MNFPSPSSFYPELTPARLQLVAEALLDLRFETLKQMSTEFDDGYTKETAVFGRSRNMLIQMARSDLHSWMTLVHAGMDVTFKIGEVPCRFFRDDPDSPDKPNFFRRNAADGLFEQDEKWPVMWRFIVEMAFAEEDEDRVVFAGYNVYQEKVSEWACDASTPLLHSVNKDIPRSADIPAAQVDVRESEVDKSDTQTKKTGSDE